MNPNSYQINQIVQYKKETSYLIFSVCLFTSHIYRMPAVDFYEHILEKPYKTFVEGVRINLK